VRDWETKLALLLSDTLRKRRSGAVGKSWYVDETYLKVQGTWQYLYRPIDRDGNLVDVQTWPRPTLLVNSKTCGEAGRYTAFECQRDRAHVSGDTHALGIGEWPP
jgi:DDE domain